MIRSLSCLTPLHAVLVVSVSYAHVMRAFRHCHSFSGFLNPVCHGQTQDR